ncbi:hypothetical protein [Sessilibacter sp. MAH2]
MNYLKPLQKNGVYSEDLEDIAKLLEDRASSKGFKHPQSVYHSMAVDLALGTLEMKTEAESELGKSHSLKDWLAIILGQ